MSKTGATKTGEAKTGEGAGGQTISAPVSTVNVSTPEPSVFENKVAAPVSTVTTTTPEPAVEEPPHIEDVGDPNATVAPSTKVGVESWAFEGMEFGTVTDISLTHKQITLTYLLTESELSRMRSWVTDSGKFRRTVEHGGPWRVIDTSIRGNEFAISPPDEERPPHDHYRVVVDKLDDTPESRSGDRHEVRLTGVLTSPIEPGQSNDWSDETADTGEWLFEFHRGDVATSRVSRDLTRKDSGGKGGATLNLVLSADEAAVLVESARHVDATRTVEISDGTTRSEDTSVDGGNTVTITPPTNGERFIESGTYVIVGWEVVRANSNTYRVQVEVNSQL